MASSAPAQPADRARGATRHPAGFGLLGGVGVQAAPQHLLAGEPLIPAPIRAAPGHQYQVIHLHLLVLRLMPVAPGMRIKRRLGLDVKPAIPNGTG